MGILGRYVFREVLISSVLGTFLATFVTFLHGSDKLFEQVAGSNASLRTIITLFAWAIPPLLPLTIPFGVLVGILIGLGRLSSDGEIIAMRAAGVSSRKVIAPVLLFAIIGVAIAALASITLTPISARETARIITQMNANRLSADIPPRVFDEDFPNRILYVGEVVPGKITVWKPVFIVDVTPPENRTSGLKDKAAGPLVTVAREAIATSDARSNRIQLSMKDSATHEMSKDGRANDSSAEHSLQALDANPPNQETLRASAMNVRDLLRYRGPDWLENKIELHRRFALPLACLVLAMLGIPIGITTRKGGKSAAYVNAIFLAFFCYYLSFITLVGFAKQRAIPVEVALWIPNEFLGLLGIVFLSRMEIAGDRDLLTFTRELVGRVWNALKSKTSREDKAAPGGSFRFFLVPQLVDTYVLQSFLFYFGLLLASFVSLALIFNFFELMGDMVKHSNLTTVLKYLFFLTPSLIYQLAPPSELVAILITLGVLSKQNEITAFKACGVSLYRLSLPLLVTSIFFSGLLFAFNYSYVPAANLVQNRLRNQIKDRKVESWLRADRKWTLGHNSRIYYYRYFDPAGRAMIDVNVFDLDPASFRLEREIIAARADWDAGLRTWVFRDGWSTSFQGAFSKDYSAFHGSLEPRSFANLTERPEYFLKEATQDTQMNFIQLEQYIADLARSGFNTTKLQVQLHLKFSVPILCFVMALIAIPFGYMVGNRGAMTGIGVSFGIAVSYLAIGKFFEKLGDVSLLPPAMAAWAPDIAFALVGLYMFMRMRS